VSLIPPVRTSYINISPAVELVAKNYYPCNHDIDVIDPPFPLSFFIGSFYFPPFVSHIFTVLLTDPAAIYFDLGENIQQFTETGSSWAE